MRVCSGWRSPAPGAVSVPDVAARVRITVHYTFAEHERVWQSGPAALADIAALVTASPRVVVDEQAGSGHDLSVGRSAMAYHLKVLSFAEECALARENEVSPESDIDCAGHPVPEGSRASNGLAGRRGG